ncbi:diguanylate cyclase [Acinetobacter sp. MB5]|uniref:diguanylate cyclase n=1 Tax=Acinetobacter sp. MB5 TaxID=2069438 RepID=UPI000DD02E83|nr:diguanylate cyclase [Acinetobacter sp. MB5]
MHPHQQSFWRQNLTPASFIILASTSFVVLAVIIYWMIFLNTQRTLYNQTEQQAWVRVHQISNAVSVQVQTLFTGLNYSMMNMKNSYELHDEPAFQRAVNNVVTNYPEDSIIQIAIADEHGKLVYSNLKNINSEAKPVYITDREHFKVHLQQNIGLYISKPVMGRVSKKWTIQLTKALYRDHKFIGVMILSLSPDYISKYFQNIFDNPVDVILLAREDGTYLARSQYEDQVLGKSLPAERLFLFQHNPNGGTYEAKTGPDQLQRMYAWKRVQGFPLIISSGIERQHTFAALEQAYQRNFIYNLIGSIFLLVIVFISAWLALQRQRNLAMLVQQKRRFMYLADEVPGGLFQVCIHLDKSISMPFTNPSFFELHGIQPFSEEHFQLHYLTECIHPDDLEGLRKTITHSLFHKKEWDVKYRVVDADGSIRWLRNHAKAQIEEDGSILWHGYILDITHDEILQETLRQKEEHLRLTFMAVQDGLWQWNYLTDELTWDQRCYEMLGYENNAFELSFEDFLNRFVHPQDHNVLMQHLSEHLKHDHEFRIEARLKTFKNTWLWVEVRGKVTQRSLADLPTKMLGTYTDIQKRVEHAHLVKAVLDRSNSLIMVTSSEHEIIYANERAATLFNLPYGEQKTKITLDHLHKNDNIHLKLDEIFLTVQQSGHVRTEWPLYIQNDRLNWFDIQGALLDPEDHSGNTIWTLNDIDARHRAESGLVKAQQRLETLVERFPSGILIVDTINNGHQHTVAANKMLISTLGLDISLAQLIELPINELEKRLYSTMGVSLNLMVDEPTKSFKKTIMLRDGRYLEIENLSLVYLDQLIGQCWIFHDITPQKERESQLEALALTDALTGISNRRAFLNRLKVELDDIQKEHISCSALIMLDIDHFKKVNDTYGHAVGDLVLKHLVKILSEQMDKNDLLGRLGGEEFVILLSNINTVKAFERAELFRESIISNPAIVSNIGMISFAVSLGIYMLKKPENSIENSLDRADSALYFSKRNGRNCSTLWQETMPKNNKT